MPLEVRQRPNLECIVLSPVLPVCLKSHQALTSIDDMSRLDYLSPTLIHEVQSIKGAILSICAQCRQWARQLTSREDDRANVKKTSWKLAADALALFGKRKPVSGPGSFEPESLIKH